MAYQIRLETDDDFQDAMERQSVLRIFRGDDLIESSVKIVRFDENRIVVQADISDMKYYARQECEFFEQRQRR
ncbi:hypothetical protein [Paenibacillus bovis]|uniref:Uncharacterized protein n=1 Tax=Paenibacillus bovis TaxID=1616788 RepID=A0A172ZJL8_9BACL|nr:hypothetical protein [Paenibacillus bovis]ANF97320.1 hypothetical protein AR543_15805 [Paenibacillus bovis]